jgi:predicted Rossmann fold nucleotide-binding protein DprA/Smf involved in DNA uptake
MIKTYIRVELSSEGESPKQIIERMRGIGAVPMVGDYDFELRLTEDERLFDKLEEIHRALKGSHVRYIITTRTDAEAEDMVKSKREITHYVGEKPVELKKALYRAKLDRWKEMGLDVAELEELLEKDLESFKAASKQFLRVHLDRMIVKDKRPADNVIDGHVLAVLDDQGKSMRAVVQKTGLSEDEVMLSLGRLISSGGVSRVQRDDADIFLLVPPPAPPSHFRKTVQLIPASDETEAQLRVVNSISSDGTSSKDLLRATKLPRDQFVRALKSLQKVGKVKILKKNQKDFYYIKT